MPMVLIYIALDPASIYMEYSKQPSERGLPKRPSARRIRTIAFAKQTIQTKP